MSHPLCQLPTTFRRTQESKVALKLMPACAHGQAVGRHTDAAQTDSRCEKSWDKEDKLFLNGKDETPEIKYQDFHCVESSVSFIHSFVRSLVHSVHNLNALSTLGLSSRQ